MSTSSQNDDEGLLDTLLRNYQLLNKLSEDYDDRNGRSTFSHQPCQTGHRVRDEEQILSPRPQKDDSILEAFGTETYLDNDIQASDIGPFLSLQNAEADLWRSNSADGAATPHLNAFARDCNYYYEGGQFSDLIYPARPVFEYPFRANYDDPIFGHQNHQNHAADPDRPSPSVTPTLSLADSTDSFGEFPMFFSDAMKQHLPTLEQIKAIPFSPKNIVRLGRQERDARISRPLNAFLLFRRWNSKALGDEYAEHKLTSFRDPNARTLSKFVAEKWRRAPIEIRLHYEKLQIQEKLEHRLKYPDWKYSCSRAKKENNTDSE